jgi:hypothetical protein
MLLHSLPPIMIEHDQLATIDLFRPIFAGRKRQKERETG